MQMSGGAVYLFIQYTDFVEWQTLGSHCTTMNEM